MNLSKEQEMERRFHTPLPNLRRVREILPVPEEIVNLVAWFSRRQVMFKAVRRKTASGIIWHLFKEGTWVPLDTEVPFYWFPIYKRG